MNGEAKELLLLLPRQQECTIAFRQPSGQTPGGGGMGASKSWDVLGWTRTADAMVFQSMPRSCLRDLHRWSKNKSCKNKNIRQRGFASGHPPNY